MQIGLFDHVEHGKRPLATLFDERLAFAKAAEDAKNGCPVSGALKGNVQFELENDPRARGLDLVLDEEGKVIDDGTVTRLDDDRFRVVTGGAHGMADLKWYRDHLPEDGD